MDMNSCIKTYTAVTACEGDGGRHVGARFESRALVEKKFPDVVFRWDEPLARHTTFQVGGPVSCLASPRTLEALAALIKDARVQGVPYVILGGGSNILAPDGPLDILIVRMDPNCGGDIRCEAADGERRRLYVGAGVGLPRLLRFCLKNSLLGFEPLVGIPGDGRWSTGHERWNQRRMHHRSTGVGGFSG
jgi:UDP-N-acetylmuramate dehydrogenase